MGRAKVEPLHIETDRTVKPIQQKQQPIALEYKTLFGEDIEQLEKEGVVSLLLDSSHATGRISYAVIIHKNRSDKKIIINIFLLQHVNN